MEGIRWIEFIKKNCNAICSLAVISVILAIALRSIQEAYFTLPSFDGAIFLQVPVNLIKYGRYATSYNNSILDFDHFGIQSGAPFLLPIYFMFFLFGKSSFAAQLVNSTYLILTVVLIYYLTAWHSNKCFAIACLLLFMLTPYMLEYGHHIYGEIPALFYCLSSLLLLYKLERNPDSPSIFLPFFTGFSYGLAYLTKTIVLIMVPSIIFFLMIDLMFIHKLKMKHYILMFIGFLLPILVFECYKMISIGADAYLKWWKEELTLITKEGGVKVGLKDTENLYKKTLKHSRLFCTYFRINIVVMICFLCIPPIIFIINFLKNCIDNKKYQVSLTLAVMYGTACTYMVWWMFITPTARAWPRRIISGYILQEIALVISLYLLWKYLSNTHHRVHFSKKVVGGIAFTVLLFVILFQGLVFAKHFNFLFKPAQEKLDAERIAKIIERLPENAKIYGVGWWQAPILSFLSDRMFLDILQYRLPKYPVKLQDSYIVIDWPDAMEHVIRLALSKTKNRLVEKQGYNYLYQIEHIIERLPNNWTG